MLNSNADGLKALHRVLVKARARAYEDDQTRDLGPILDGAETLLSYITSDDDMSGLFADQLRALGTQFPDFAGVSKDYEAGNL